MPAQLVPLDNTPSILVDKPILLLGRHPECDIQIDSRKVSRRHCCIAQVSDYLVVRDLGSTNGIRINGQPVQEGCLHEGDELTIGQLRYQVSWSPDGNAGASPPPPASPLAAPGDDPLESCDEPVALPDPDRPATDKPARLPPTVSNPDSPSVPDNLDLLSGSGVQLPPPS